MKIILQIITHLKNNCKFTILTIFSTILFIWLFHNSMYSFVAWIFLCPLRTLIEKIVTNDLFINTCVAGLIFIMKQIAWVLWQKYKNKLN